MNIDFYTLIAQIINLLILLFLLRKFLYVPVLKAVEERQAKNLQLQKEIAQQKEKADKMEQQLAEKLADIDVQKQEILKQTRQSAEALFKQLEDQARENFAAETLKWKNVLLSEQQSFEAGIQSLVAEYFSSFAEKAFAQLADINFNNLILHKLSDKINALSLPQKKEILSPFKQKKFIEVITADTLTEKTQTEFAQFLQKTLQLSKEAELVFSTDKEIICGVRIKAEETVIEWNLAEYLAEFNKKLHTEVTNLINRG